MSFLDLLSVYHTNLYTLIFLVYVHIYIYVVLVGLGVYAGGGGIDCGAGFVYVGSINCAWQLPLYSSTF
jgi:hypothetical protein